MRLFQSTIKPLPMQVDNSVDEVKTASPGLRPHSIRTGLAPIDIDMKAQRKKCLIVDDSKINCKILAKKLSHHECTIANSGVEAIELFKLAIAKKAPFDIVFMDLEMPGMNGVQTSEVIYELDKQILIYCVSERVSNQEEFDNLNSRMNNFLKKSPTREQLQEAIEKASFSLKTGLSQIDKGLFSCEATLFESSPISPKLHLNKDVKNELNLGQTSILTL